MNANSTSGDFTAGMLLVQAILLALIAREKTGCGQEVYTSLLDGLIARHKRTMRVVAHPELVGRIRMKDPTL